MWNKCYKIQRKSTSFFFPLNFHAFCFYLRFIQPHPITEASPIDTTSRNEASIVYKHALSFIQHENPKITYIQEVTLFSWLDIGINFKDSTSRHHSRWIGTKSIRGSQGRRFFFNVGWMRNTLIYNNFRLSGHQGAKLRPHFLPPLRRPWTEFINVSEPR